MFTFSLEPVLKHREHIEETLQKDLSVLQRLLFEKQEQLLNAQVRHDELRDRLEHKQRQESTVGEILLYVKYLERIALDLRRRQQEVVDAEQKMNAKRNELVAAVKKRKMLDKLKEHSFTAYTKEERRREEKVMNDVAVSQFSRSR